jgi:hypothetical protein
MSVRLGGLIVRCIDLCRLLLGSIGPRGCVRQGLSATCKVRNNEGLPPPLSYNDACVLISLPPNPPPPASIQPNSPLNVCACKLIWHGSTEEDRLFSPAGGEVFFLCCVVWFRKRGQPPPPFHHDHDRFRPPILVRLVPPRCPPHRPSRHCPHSHIAQDTRSQETPARAVGISPPPHNSCCCQASFALFFLLLPSRTTNERTHTRDHQPGRTTTAAAAAAVVVPRPLAAH